VAPSAPPGKRGSLIAAISIKAYLTDFRLIPLGDLNLLQEMWLNGGAGVVRQKHGRTPLRRMYSARIHGSKSNMAVALYQGGCAEAVCHGFLGWISCSLPSQIWREEVSRYSNLR
jgi:hypothetical protein